MRRSAGVRWLGRMLTLAVVSGCGLGAPPPAPAPPAIAETAGLETLPPSRLGDLVRLRFDWPDGATGRCRSTHRIADDGATTVRSEVTYRVRVEHDAEQVRIVTDEVTSATAPAGLGGATRLVEVVDRDGGYLRADGVEAMLAAHPELHADVTTPAGAAALVRERLARTWKLLVGAWAGRELPLGATYAATAPEPVAGGASIRVRIAIRADGRVPCRSGEGDLGCVRLRFVSQPEDTAAQVLVPRLLAELAPAAAADADLVVPTAATVTTTALLVTEPDTLLPHRFVVRQHLLLRASSPDQAHIERERHEEIVRVCAWRG